MRRIIIYGQMCLYDQVYKFVREVAARIMILSHAILI